MFSVQEQLRCYYYFILFLPDANDLWLLMRRKANTPRVITKFLSIFKALPGAFYCDRLAAI